jgi:hypothetical protein
LQQPALIMIHRDGFSELSDWVALNCDLSGKQRGKSQQEKIGSIAIPLTAQACDKVALDKRPHTGQGPGELGIGADGRHPHQ